VTGDTAESRLRLLEDERDVLRTLYAYGSAIDYGLEGEFADCWTEDAVLVWGKTPHRELPQFPVRRFEGRGAIVEAFRAHTHAPELFHKHLLYQPRIRIEGDQAFVESGFGRLDESPEGPVIRSFGRYLDELARCEDGRWRFVRREAEVESVVRVRAAVAAS
jgi:ketosteroid isomerase-like protein